MKKPLLFLISCAIILTGFAAPQKTGYLEQAFQKECRAIISAQMSIELEDGTNHGTAFLGRILERLERALRSNDKIIAELRLIGREDFTTFDTWCKKHNLYFPPIESFRRVGEVLAPGQIIRHLECLHRTASSLEIGRASCRERV